MTSSDLRPPMVLLMKTVRGPGQQQKQREEFSLLLMETSALCYPANLV